MFNNRLVFFIQPHDRHYEAMNKMMEDITTVAGARLKHFRSRYGASTAAIFTFVCSVARTSLECELVQRGPRLLQQPQLRYKPRNDCIGQTSHRLNSYTCPARVATQLIKLLTRDTG